jgi:hypothetical protein
MCVDEHGPTVLYLVSDREATDPVSSVPRSSMSCLTHARPRRAVWWSAPASVALSTLARSSPHHSGPRDGRTKTACSSLQGDDDLRRLSTLSARAVSLKQRRGGVQLHNGIERTQS